MEKLVIQTPAKINFGLHIIEQRPDKYHNIETIFYPIKLYDTLTFEESDHFEVITNSNELNENKFNLIIEAKDLLQSYTDIKMDVKITLDKKIPIGAGMGGGSSDAAATLIGLIKLYEININEDLLKKFALQIGSDVPFFLNPVPSLAFARGEDLIPLDNFSIDFNILLIYPNINISTKWAFSKLKLAAHDFSLREITPELWKDTKRMRSLVRNDFERSVFGHFPVLSEIKKKLYSLHAQYVLMTGTGSTIFALFRNKDEAANAKAVFEEKFFTFLQLRGKN